MLKDARCEYLQSSTFCEPMVINETVMLLEKHQRPKA